VDWRFEEICGGFLFDVLPVGFFVGGKNCVKDRGECKGCVN
jgi:hypothetical protein